ncbi:MAG TPA: hypothetical protein VNU21_08060 [Usitatibacter sp.]|nr:hypothetical protein [Usitatibacter sp.]
MPAAKDDSVRDNGASQGAHRAVIARPVLDRLIKEKIGRTVQCEGVEPLPVTCVQNGARGCNWKVPGYLGDHERVARCEAAIAEYLDFLAAQFDVDEN